MLTDQTRWSLGRGKPLVPSRWQATYCAHVTGMRVFTVVAQIHWISWLTFIPHGRIVWSRLPVARVRASGLNTTA